MYLEAPAPNILGAGEIIHSSKEPSYQSVSPCHSQFNFSKTIADKDNLVRFPPTHFLHWILIFMICLHGHKQRTLTKGHRVLETSRSHRGDMYGFC